MTDDRSPINAALDLFLFAPLGLALTIGEELPKLAEKGRAKLTSRVTTARVVGQFTVAQGRRQVDRRAARRPGEAPSAAGSVNPDDGVSGRLAMSGPVGAPVPASAPAPEPKVPSAPVGSDHTAPPVPHASPPVPPPAPPAPSASEPPRLSNGAGSTPPPSANSLAIPGYDSLSASQVVQRLAGLSTAELEAVKAYEAANRGRRTVLARVGQLQAG